MIRYQDRDGEIFEGRDAVDVVDQLRLASKTGRGQTSATFMKAYARRAGMMAGHDIRTATEARFVEDLVAAGLLTAIADQQ